MNAMERKMVELLKEMKETYHAVGVKTEFEGEGIRLDDLMRQKEITMAAGLPIALKIGGGEAITDLSLARTVGVGKIIAPMLEPPFAVRKFVEAAYKVYTEDELQDTKLVVNFETIHAYRCYQDVVSAPEFSKLSGIAMGRKDLTLSMGLPRSEMDSTQVSDVCRGFMQMTKGAAPNMTCTIGGIKDGEQSLDVLRAFGSLLDSYETRKVIFSAEALAHDPLTGLKKGLEFEILYYENKKAYYKGIANSDNNYLERLYKKYQSFKK